MLIRTISGLALLAVLLGVVAPGASSADEGMVVIANKSLGVEQAEVSTLKRIFLGKSTKLDSGEKVTFAVLADGATHESFLKEVVGKTPSQFVNYWRKMTFSGKGTTPQTFESEDALVAFVASTEGAIGYVSAGTERTSVTVISVQ